MERINESAWPVTRTSIAADLSALGVTLGMTLIVHSSLKSMNRWIVGGASAIVLALEDAIGEEGTLVMPTHTGDLSDPAPWQNPAVPEVWWQLIRDEMPAFQPDLTPTRAMGAVVECFRKQDGTLRSCHPQLSFAARGPQAAYITSDHSLANGLGEQSPLAKLYELGASVLLFGVDHGNNTSIHLAEYRAKYAKKHVTNHAPILVDGRREWAALEEINLDADDFDVLGQAFEEETGCVKLGKIGDAVIRIVPVRELVDFGVSWMEQHRE
ncbi:aminoglycoside 3-N-acetyltransferase [Paenibacillus taihuensis]|uniref:Aminoglycoside N(3)-acetyltransferase n=1 Tax=Paenibacillus taihuensis TaxID=1156355 RepID=A0A3D9SL13_9BACL|nr:AAC(3) family N-acetyltransferase [Paenibacillus taihuensis]REE94593.1 aminoglycoside 3-N-acetyltransferase [Paenibacillus taihuensis]